MVEGGLKKLKKTVASDKLQAWPKSLKKMASNFKFFDFLSQSFFCLASKGPSPKWKNFFCLFWSIPKPVFLPSPHSPAD